MERDEKPPDPNSQAAGPVSRRDFLAATAVTGIALGSGPSVSALAQDGPVPNPAAAQQGGRPSSIE